MPTLIELQKQLADMQRQIRGKKKLERQAKVKGMMRNMPFPFQTKRSILKITKLNVNLKGRLCTI